MKRRVFIKNSAALSGLTYFGLGHSLFSSSAFAAQTPASHGKTLVVIFQRGAADALSVLSPTGDSNYNKEIRPNLFIPAAEMLKADSYFSFHPALGGFKSLWDQGLLTAVHQVGSPSVTRSHFDAQDYLESGTPDVKSTESGFLSRAAEKLPDYEKLKVSALSVQPGVARMVAGDAKSLSFSDLSKFSISGLGPMDASNRAGFEAFFDEALDEVLEGRSQHSSALLSSFAEAQKIEISSEWKAAKRNKLSDHLQDIAKIIKSNMQIPVIVTEAGGWDTHVNQGSANGQLANRLKEFSDSISAFVKELGPKINDVTIVTVSEFGRTVRENGSKGTDHGHGSCYFIINGKLKPKTIHGDWKDLKHANLYEERDLPVTTDFRQVFSEILKHQFAVKNFEDIFPNWKAGKSLGLFT